MDIHNIIVHELIKEQGNMECESFLSEDNLNDDANSVELVEKLNESFYKNSNPLYARFNEEENHFLDQFSECHNNNYIFDSFQKFSKDSIIDLRNLLRATVGAKGGYFVYSHYTYRQKEMLGIFLIRDTEGVLFRREDNNFEIETVTYLNIEKLAMACRIDINKYANNLERYLQITKNNQIEISEYFLNWIGIDRPESSKEFTDTLIEILADIPLPIDPETNEEVDIDRFKKSIHEYISGSPNQIVNLYDIGDRFYYNRDILSDYVENNNITIDTEFRAYKNSLKKLYRYDIKAGSIQLKYTIGDWRSKKIELGSDNKVIINSKDLFEHIRTEMENNG